VRNRVLFSFVALGVLAGLVSAYVYARPKHALPPAFNPASNPYGDGIYANGIVESYQTNGENVNIYPEVSGTVTKVFVTEGQSVKQGDVLFVLDDSVQRALVEQQRSQADAASAMLDELKAQPRRENLEVARAQVEMATASLKSAQDQLDKQRHSIELDPRSVSKDALDNATNAAKVARANLDVVTRQYELTKAGAWIYDRRNQERQVEALNKGMAASSALLAKYTVKAAADGVVLSIHASAGNYLSPQGIFDSYTQEYAPAVTMGSSKGFLGVRCYIDEILIPRLPPAATMQAKMFIRGTAVSVPLEFVRIQPYVSPKIQLSNQRTERVDLRVLPVIFRVVPPKGVDLYPGQLVDVYVAAS
jgi:HlyD family secretion protein